MKAKYALIVLLAITFWGCDDNTAGLGLRMFPESDRDINGKLSTFDVTTESVHAGYAAENRNRYFSETGDPVRRDDQGVCRIRRTGCCIPETDPACICRIER